MNGDWGLFVPRGMIPRINSYVDHSGEDDWYMLLRTVHGARVHYKPLDSGRALCGLDFDKRGAYLGMGVGFVRPCARCSRAIKRLYRKSQGVNRDD